MNYSTLSFITSDEVIGVKCIFRRATVTKPHSIDDALARMQANANVKRYTYKTVNKDLKVGDLVIVQTNNVDAFFGLGIAEVAEVNVELDFNNEIDYKWVVNKVDISKLHDLLTAEEALINKVKNMERASKKQQLLAALGLTGAVNLKLSDFSASSIVDVKV